MSSDSISAQSLARLHGAELSRISHAFRTPLTSIVGFADAILTDPTLATDQKEEFARIIKTEGERLSKFVDELLYVSFAAHGNGRRELWDLGTVVSTSFHEASISASSRSIALHCTVPSDTPRLPLDREFVTQMLDNMIANALWCAPDNSEIFVNARVGTAELALSVLSHRKHLSSPADASRVGLARTRFLATLFGGSLEVEEEGAGETVVTLNLPLEG